MSGAPKNHEPHDQADQPAADAHAQPREFDQVAANADVMTVEEAAKFLRVGRNQLYTAIMRGEIPHGRIGKTIRLTRSGLVRWLNRSCDLAEAKGRV
jgi:excisionase family DNA binding protein